MRALQVLAVPTRLKILRLVWDDEMAASDIARHFDVSFGAVSQHLRRLRDADLVVVRPEGRLRYYRANRAVTAPLEPLIRSMWAANLDNVERAPKPGDTPTET